MLTFSGEGDLERSSVREELETTVSGGLGIDTLIVGTEEKNEG